LGLKPETVHDAKKQIRYATAWFNWELTKIKNGVADYAVLVFGSMTNENR
jgi:hypothetical protein